jgi:hypothetical protein
MKLSHSIKKSFLIPALLVAGLAAFTPSLHAATTLLDNTSAALSKSSALVWNSEVRWGLVFSTGSTAYNLGSIEFATEQNATGNLTLSLFQANPTSKKPTGSALATDTFSYVADEAGVVAEDLTGFSVAANSFYVLTLATNVFDGSIWIAEPDTTLSGGSSGLTYLGREFSTDGGSSWGGPFEDAVPWMKLTDTASQAGPEPSALALLALGAGGLLARRRRVG